ncbi:MAG: protein-glutamate O-methyltransferase CheR [Acidobacteria bacterium]|nr:protein-glutamate O-methyltransferase CheR [Acidobacteriota bacterium]
MTRVVLLASIERFRSIVANRLGLHFEEAKTGFLGDVLQRRLDQSGKPCESYLELLAMAGSQAELCAVARELTVGETYFFRNIDQFRAFSEVALPNRMHARNSEKRLRILSAGCASGEEAYSIAMLLQGAAIDPDWDISILAVDINPAMIDAAVAGRFSEWALRETPAEIRRQWFRSTSRGVFSVDPSLRHRIRLEVRNLVEDDPQLWMPGAYDVIFCRNVIMYFTPDASRAVVARMTRALAPGGYLFLGHAETLRGLSQDFHLRHTHGTFYYQRKDRTWAVGQSTVGALCEAQARQRAASSNERPGAVSEAKPTAAAPPLEFDTGTTWIDAIRQASERIEKLAEKHPLRSEPDARPGGSPRLKWDLSLPLELLQRERFTAALDLLQALPPESAGDPDVLLLHAVLLAHRGQFAAAQEVCRRLLEIDELNAGAHYVSALCHEGSGDMAEASNQDRIAGYLDPSFAMPHLHLGLIARRRGEHTTGRHELGQALTLLEREDAARLLLFGGGFSRNALIALCRAELTACGGSYE